MFRNKEIRILSAVIIVITVVTTIAGFFIHPMAGALALISAACYITTFVIFTRLRYRKLAKIADQIDLVLHKADRLFISDETEGELSILQSEITKLTLTIREQNAMLRNEKKLLADSLADVAHQLRTPLTSITLILSLLETTDDTKERLSLLHETDELLIQMDWLLTSLLKISRLDAGIVSFNTSQCNLSTLVKRASHPFLITMELHDISLINNVPENVEINCDASWLSESLQNLLKNSIEHIADHGLITFDCEDTTLFTELTIHDSGSGFADEDLPHLFDRFYRGQNSNATGYGIGLALCRMIIANQGGTITAKNHPQGGAMFIIRFQK